MKSARCAFLACFVISAACHGDSADPGPQPVLLDGGPGSVDAGPPIVTECGAHEESFGNLGGSHVTGDIVYDDPPPVSGNHNPNWARWGVHSEAVPDQCFVHNLEHGGVVFLYNCPEGCAPEVATMADFVDGRVWALLTPYADLPGRFAVVSWGHRIVSDCMDIEAFEDFYNARVNQGPESLSIQPSTECK
jgi:hypothetical protein